MKSKFVFLAAGLLLIAICGVGVSQTNPGRTAGGYPWLVGAIDSGGNAIKATLASHGVWIGNGTAPVVKTLPDCVDTGGQHLNFTQSTDVFSCGTSGGGGRDLARANALSRPSAGNYGGTEHAFAFDSGKHIPHHLRISWPTRDSSIGRILAVVSGTNRPIFAIQLTRGRANFLAARRS